jgi:hypothetical protein
MASTIDGAFDRLALGRDSLVEQGDFASDIKLGGVMGRQIIEPGAEVGLNGGVAARARRRAAMTSPRRAGLA